MSHFRLWAALALLGLSTISVMADGVCVGAPSRHVPTIFKIPISKNLGARLPMKQAVYVYRKASSISSPSAPSGAALPMSMKSDKGWSEATRLDSAPSRKIARCSCLCVPIFPSIAVCLNKPTRGKHATAFVIFNCIAIANVGIVKPYIDACIHSFCIVHVNGLNNFNYSKYFGRPSDPSHKQHNICEFGISGATTSGRSSTSTSVASETSPASSPVPSSGITSGAAAGIGIGVAIVVVAVAVIAFCLLRNRKKQAAPRHSIEISKPLPGSGPTYPTRDGPERDRDSYDKYGHDIEMTSHRYEDMIPSQQPRNMV
ncbi:hypothetical protein BBO_07394 [Beauveria brongniartii RCEF 3172]|uniref:Uncharacterized protein n=1 Tax=Beauveria brongniartii RCEF 3172 TaxID=1081107 RepID=A0A166ZKI2_9HYPO|nr:hypothetical protein BBO_07394 [Beauveria brongniartii RCEF 3172]